MSSVERDAFLSTIRRARSSATKSEFVRRACSGASVLDIGCLDHSAAKALAAGSGWLHTQVQGVARSLVGLDFLSRDVETMNQLGYNILVGDAESFQLGERFDVVLAADVLEHLSNPGSFLERAREHLVRAGRLVVTTPNPFALGHFAHVIVRGDIAVNDEHTAWLDPMVLFELLRRYRFVVHEFTWLHADRSSDGGRSALDIVGRPLFRWRPLLQRNYGVIATPS